MNPTDRKIFEYCAGPDIGPRAADPLEVQRNLTIHLGGSLSSALEEWLTSTDLNTEGLEGEEKKLAQQEEAMAQVRVATAEQRLVDAARAAFEMQPFEKETGRGATDSEALTVLNEFIKFLTQKKT